MKTKRTLPILCVVLAFTPVARAALPVTDALRQAQAEVHHRETMLTLAEVTKNQRDQLTALNQQFTQLEKLNAVVGDPLKVTSLPGSEAVLGTSSGVAVGSTGSGGVAVTITASLAQLDGGHGIFTVIGDRFKTLDGTEVTRNESNYLPSAALIGARTDHEAVLKQVMERRQKLRDAGRQTLEAIRAASTLAEGQKLQGVLAALHLELDATDRDLFFAAQKTELQDIDNRNNKERQTTARNEEQATEIRTALARMTESLRPNTRPVSFRQNR